jgi:hypothetical protein
MNESRLTSKLIAVARRLPADDRVPYAFEQRVLARLRALSPVDPWAWWARGLWRAALPCLAVAVVSIAWASSEVADEEPGYNSDELTGSFELALYENADSVDELR